MSYIEEFLDELSSRKGFSSLYRNSKTCTECGEKEKRFASVCFNDPISKSQNYFQQIRRKHKDCIFDIENIHKQKNMMWIMPNEIDIFLNQLKVKNYSNIDISFFKSYKKRRDVLNNKNIVLLEMFCAKCANLLHSCTFHRDKIPESFFRKLK